MREVNFTYSQAGGAEGQTVDSKVNPHWDLSGDSTTVSDRVRREFRRMYPELIDRQGQVVVTSQRFRDQGRNLAVCLDQLRQRIITTIGSAAANSSRTPLDNMKTSQWGDQK